MQKTILARIPLPRRSLNKLEIGIFFAEKGRFYSR
jgi:hypothetical protein